MSFLDYELPEELIAQEPLADRSSSRLLVVNSQGHLRDAVFHELPHLLSPGDLLVYNDTRVTARRLEGRRESGGKVELFVLRREGPGRWECLCRPAKRLRIGSRVWLDAGAWVRVVQSGEGGLRSVEIEDRRVAEEALLESGEVPLPPYIHRKLEDPERYQTVFASQSGSAAAPTAGLHFTEKVLQELASRGVLSARVTLDVSLDTFRPMASSDSWSHPIHGERCNVPQATVEAIQSCRGRIIAVGTTTVRTLETMAVAPRSLRPGSAKTRLFIRPGYKFLVVGGIITNFHLPRTSMLLMISAFLGSEPLRNAYEHAVRKRYRFLSFGDAMLAVR